MNTRPRIQAKRILTPLLISLLIGSAFLLYFIPLKVHAVTNPSLVWDTTSSSHCPNPCGSSYTISTVFIPSNVLNQNMGLILSIDCKPSTTTITSVTDNLGTTWQKAVRIQPTGTGSGELESWFTNLLTGYVQTSYTITVNFSPSAQECFNFVDYTQPTGSGIVQTIGLATFSGSSGPVRQASTFGAVPSLNAVLGTQSITNPIGSFIVSFAVANETGPTGQVAISPQAPLIDLKYLFQAGNLDYEHGYTYLSNATTSRYFTKFTTTTQVSTIFRLALIVVVYTIQTANPPSCTGANGCTEADGGNSLTSSTFTLIGNTTYFYLGSTPTTGKLIFNMTLKVHDYTNGGAGKGTDKVYLSIYTMKAGQISPSTVISAGTPLNLAFSLLKTINTGAGVTQWSTNPSTSVPANTTYAIAVMSRFAGLTVFQTLASVTLEADTIDTNVGQPPPQITTYSDSSPAIFFYKFAIIPQQIINRVQTSTVTTSIGAVTKTETQYVYSLQSDKGGTAIVQDIITFSPIIILPLFMGGLFGMIGVFIGLILGVVIGGTLGIIPQWAIFLLIAAIFYIIVRREI